MGRKTGRPVTQEDMDFVWTVYQKHRGIIYKTAYESRATQTDVDEIVNESILILAENAGRLRALAERPLAVYVAAVVRSAALMMARSARREESRCGALPEERGGAIGADIEEDFIEREARVQRLAFLEEALGELSPEDCEALTMKYIKGLSDGEIAERLDLRPGTLRVRLTRARRRAREIIERKEAEADARADQQKRI